MRNNEVRYGRIAVFMHWFSLLALIVIYACTELRYLPDSDDTTELMKSAHYSVGLLMFFMVWGRLAMRLTSPVPKIIPALTSRSELMAKLGHWSLYAFLIGMPLCGWFYLSSRGLPIGFFGIDMPALISKHVDWINNIKYIHYYGGSIGYALIGLHATAALYHHYIRRDNTLRRMLLNFDDKVRILPPEAHENLVAKCRSANSDQSKRWDGKDRRSNSRSKVRRR